MVPAAARSACGPSIQGRQTRAAIPAETHEHAAVNPPRELAQAHGCTAAKAHSPAPFASVVAAAPAATSALPKDGSVLSWTEQGAGSASLAIVGVNSNSCNEQVEPYTNSSTKGSADLRFYRRRPLRCGVMASQRHMRVDPKGARRFSLRGGSEATGLFRVGYSMMKSDCAWWRRTGAIGLGGCCSWCPCCSRRPVFGAILSASGRRQDRLIRP